LPTSGEIEQLLIAFLVSFVFMLLVANAAPFRHTSDGSFAEVCGFALTTVFFFAVVVKVGVPSSPPPHLDTRAATRKPHARTPPALAHADAVPIPRPSTRWACSPRPSTHT
tara:strand:+ start:253 stop:585 length:333 start_codon:yes stop_codon:yes gene_type:complete